MKNNLLLVMTAILSVALCKYAAAGAQEINCSADLPSTTKCYKCGDNCTAKLESNGNLTISGTGTIDEYAFGWRSDIKNVVIDEGIKNVGMRAFGWSSIESVYIPKSVENLAYGAFQQSSINKVHFSEDSKLQTIDTDAFANAHIDNFIMPKNVTSVYKSFYGATIGNLFCDPQGSGCSDSYLSHGASIANRGTYRKEGDFYVLYDSSGNVKGRWSFDMTKQYDNKGHQLVEYDKYNNINKMFQYGDDGSVSVYNAQGVLISKTGKHFTAEELSLLLKYGNNNTISITW